MSQPKETRKPTRGFSLCKLIDSGATSVIATFSPNEIGLIGERLMEKMLREDGFRVRHFEEILYREEVCEKISQLMALCAKETINCNWESKQCEKDPAHCWRYCRWHLSNYCSKVCKNWCEARKIKQILDEVTNGRMDGRRGALDFVASKGGKTWVVEVKTGTHSELDASQRQFVERLKQEIGIGLLHFHVRLNQKIEFSIQIRPIQNK